MGMWSAILLIVVVATAGGMFRRMMDRRQIEDPSLKAEIERLKERISLLEGQKRESLEERLSNVEKIVIDEDYSLNKEINKALKNDEEK